MIRSRLGEQARRTFFKFDWTTRSRNLPVARELAALLERGAAPTLLDVGSGGMGVAAFLPPGLAVTGLDYDHPAGRPGHPFVVGDIGALPFPDRSFEVVSCVDVLEHLVPDERAGAVVELLRVARAGVVLAFPSGPAAAASDERHQRERDRDARSRSTPVSRSTLRCRTQCGGPPSAPRRCTGRRPSASGSSAGRSLPRRQAPPTESCWWPASNAERTRLRAASS